MTTVAYKDGVLAADSRATWNGHIKSNCIKIWRIQCRVDPIKGEVLFAGAGDVYAALLFKDWLETGGEPKLHQRLVAGVEGDGNDFDAFMVHKSGIYSANYLCRIEPIYMDQWAHGSGSLAALAAMACGKSAIEAVRIASRFDVYTGGRIVSMRLDEKKPKRARKRR